LIMMALALIGADVEGSLIAIGDGCSDVPGVDAIGVEERPSFQSAFPVGQIWCRRSLSSDPGEGNLDAVASGV